MVVTGQEVVSGEVLRITFHNPDNSFTVAKMLPTGGQKEIALVGLMPLIQVGQTVRAHGAWKVDPKHGRQFSVEEFHYELPTNPEAIERLLASHFLKGIGPSFAAKIVAHFGKDTFLILDENPDRLNEIEGVAKKRKKRIIEAWKARTQLQEMRVQLLSWGVTESMATKIFRRWGNEAVLELKKNPYQLAQEIQGIGFQLADQIAKKLGLDPQSDMRIDAAIGYLLWEYSGAGHTCVPLDVFLERAEERLVVPSTLIEARVLEGFKQGYLILFRPEKETTMRLALKQLFIFEQRIAKDINRLAKSPSNLRSVDIERAIVWAEDRLQLKFAEKQKEAIGMALKEKICILTGGPGTGKSTITRAIIEVLSKLTEKIALVAPTGRAAKRLREITGHYSQTIHRLLKFDPISGSFQHDSSRRLSCHLLIVDETSMVDTNLLHSLVSAIPDGAKVLFVGDADQLPSIGPGNVLKDMIESAKLPTVKLTEIYRQARFSKIIENSHRINRGEMPYLKSFPGSDFIFISSNEPQEIRNLLIDLVTKKIPEEHGFDPKKEIQVISPMRKGECGIEQINVDLQQFFSKKPREGKRPFFVGDKVIQLKNNYQKEVFNGDVGFVEAIDEEGTFVQFDETSVFYTPQEQDELSLAWAVSVHKYQGSECPCVVIPIHTQHFKLLNRNLLYTAVTRGKKLVFLVGSVKAVAIAVSQETAEKRWTGLKEALLMKSLDTTAF